MLHGAMIENSFFFQVIENTAGFGAVPVEQHTGADVRPNFTLNLILSFTTFNLN